LRVCRGSGVKPVGDGVEVSLAVAAQVGGFGQVLAKQSICVAGAEVRCPGAYRSPLASETDPTCRV
jgi:hypothetical protein